jgi:hypothetical protein
MQIEEAREMVKVAANFLASQEQAAMKDVRLEQIERRGDNEFSVVLSYPDAISTFGNLGLVNARVYKELIVNEELKEVIALRIWK